MLFSEKIWQKLSVQQQQWLSAAMDVTVDFQINLWESETQIALESLKAQGVEITIPDKAPFQAAVQEFKDSFKGTAIGDLLNRIEATK